MSIIIGSFYGVDCSLPIKRKFVRTCTRVAAYKFKMFFSERRMLVAGNVVLSDI